ncbi:helix-turn-helix transcriptional regulator [Amycolatopsis suaedae]|uniref:XRE family transcriptional regulator n=1 Tax=Amycolatopsis suaedae TaxID=2510978 RepID=A0A4Q7J3R7_9PSEU|nr:helix-turn-helix transcriptional regulator [Amycolatopsis suaedae]RZQ62150.1 XRE family transcriptional regulator [Amycolatopsis suaedae]
MRRRVLGHFLRSRRERITPEQVGLPPGGRRRTPGLRREEVAQLAGVGVTWYTWLEQGRDIRASEQVLDAVSRTLRLDPHERAHLFRLAGAREVLPLDGDSAAVTPPVRRMLAKLEPFPAVVQNTRTDILAFNRGYDWLTDIGRRPFDQRNSLRLCFLDPDWKARIADWPESMPRFVAQFRGAMATHVAEPGWKCLVKELRRESPEFLAMWNQHEVRGVHSLTKSFDHPEAGYLRFEFTYLWFGQRSEVRLATFTPADEATQAKLPVFPPEGD